MEYLSNILSHFEIIETFIIKVTILVSAVIFCLGYIWNHIKELIAKNTDNKK